jgi:hypothetical protein
MSTLTSLSKRHEPDAIELADKSHVGEQEHHPRSRPTLDSTDYMNFREHVGSLDELSTREGGQGTARDNETSLPPADRGFAAWSFVSIFLGVLRKGVPLLNGHTCSYSLLS